MKTHQLAATFFLLFSFCFESRGDLQFIPTTQTKDHSVTNVEHYTHVVDSYLKGLNEQNLELILSLYADNATVEDPVGSEQVRGIDNIRKFYSGAVSLDLSLVRTGPVRIAANEAAFPFELVMEVDGKLMKSKIIDVFRFNKEGKIVSMRAYWGPSNRKEVEE